MAKTTGEKWKDVGKRFKNRGVVLAVALGLIPLILNAFSIELGFDYAELVYAISGILVMLGILHDPKEETFFLDKDGDGVPDFLDKESPIYPGGRGDESDNPKLPGLPEQDRDFETRKKFDDEMK